MKDLRSRIEHSIQRRGILEDQYILGFSYLENLVPKKFKKLKYGITVGLKLDDGILDSIKNGPTLEYAEHYEEINSELNKIAGSVKGMLTRQGDKAEVIRATISTRQEKQYPDYMKTLSVEFSHKISATRSGLGWIGKTALFVSWKFGPRVRLVTILTNKELDTGQPVKNSLCGFCEICVKKCPTQAANGKDWSPDMRREDFFDAHSCRAKAREFSDGKLGIKETVCGICVSVCPLGRQHERTV